VFHHLEKEDTELGHGDHGGRFTASAALGAETLSGEGDPRGGASGVVAALTQRGLDVGRI
jgi:hypothetical protein